MNPDSADRRPLSNGDGSKPDGIAKTAAERPRNRAATRFSAAGTAKAVSATSLTLETKGTEYTYDLTGAVIKIGIRDATVADLREGDELHVSYVRSDDTLVAKTVARLVKRSQ